MKDKWPYIVIGVLIALLAGGAIFFFFRLAEKNNQIEKEKKKAKYWNDSLRITQTELGLIYEKYAEEKKLRKEEIAKLSYQVQLLLSLQSQVPVEVSKKGDTLFAYHNPVYKDSGATVFLKDSIWFTQENKKWVSTQKADVQVNLSLDQTVGRDSTGNFFGRVETKSKKVTITSLNTFVVDDYNPPQESPLLSSRRIFGFAGDIDSRSIAAGVVLNVNDWQVNVKYIGFSKDFSKKTPFYEKIRIGTVYYIW